MPPPATKKQKTKDRDATEKLTLTNGGNPESTTSNVLSSFQPLTLEDIRSRIQSLCERIPAIPNGQFKSLALRQGTTTTTTNDDEEVVNDEILVKSFATQLQIVLEEFELLACCINMATYQWGTERSGASDQNLSLLKGEWSSTQQQIASMVTPSLVYFLHPDLDLVVEKTTTTTTTTTSSSDTNTTQQLHKHNNGNGNIDHNNDNDKKEQSTTTLEIRENHYTRKVVNTDYLQFCLLSLARNAPLLRHVVLSNFHKLGKAIQDYLQAQKSESRTSRDFSY